MEGRFFNEILNQ